MSVRLIKAQGRQLVTGGDPEEIFPGVPSEARFESEECDYIEAPDLEKIGKAVIEKQGGFGYLVDRKIVYLWKRAGGKRAGKLTLGTCQRPKGLLAKFCDADWIITLSADHHSALRSTRYQIEANVFHELCHTDLDNDKEIPEPRLIAHDYEGFCREVELYGAWKKDLENAAKSFQQLKLL